MEIAICSGLRMGSMRGRRSVAQIRAALTTRVREAIHDVPFSPAGDADFDGMAEAAVDVFAVALDEIYESGREIPDIKRQPTTH
jgi:hypothetical protein